MSLHVAIIGGGPAGLMLARLLHILPSPPRITVFESDATPSSRSQGSTLDLHDHSGLLALRRAGLWEQFQQYARYDGESLKFVDKNFTIHFEDNDSAGNEKASKGRPEIDRDRLREILLESLPTDYIRWGRRLAEVIPVKGSDKFDLLFKDGTIESGFDFVVGADGAWSHVRSSYLSDQKPEWVGIGGIVVSIPDAREADPQTYNLVNRGSIFSYSDGKAISSQYTGDGSIKIAAWKRQDREDWAEDPKTGITTTADREEIQRFVHTNFSDWAPELINMFEHTGRSRKESDQAEDDETSQNLMISNLYMLPVDYTWEHKRGVTLIGDAAHLMTPFAGEGVNLALQDAMDMADAFASALVSTSTTDRTAAILDTAMLRAEDKIYKRSRRIRQLTYETMMDDFSSEPMNKWLPATAARVLLIRKPWIPDWTQGILQRIVALFFAIKRLV